MSGPGRSIATVLFTDIVGSTERAAELRDAGWRKLREEHDRRVRRELRRFGGHEINTAGDSFLATFEGPARAIACAGAIRNTVHELGVEIRAGLHMGEMEGAGRELGGLALNIGARVAAEAGPGEILVSRSVHDALAGSRFDFEDRGVRPLKGVPGEWRLFAVTNVSAETGEALPSRLQRLPLSRRRVLLGSAVAAALLLAGLYVARREPGPALTPEETLAAGADPGIAVLPFTVRGEGLDVWREGMVDVLSTNLDGAAGLKTIDSRTVLARWREGIEGGRSPDLAAALDIARRTGARYALIGDAVASGAGVRFGADIYDVRDGSKLGQAQVEGSPDSLFSLVDRLSIEVLRAIYQEGGRDLPEIPVLESVTTASLPALKSYLSGEVLYRSGDFNGAVAAYERASAADSIFALAIMRVGDAGQWISGWGESALEYYERAVKLSDRLPAREAMLARANRDLMLGTMKSLDSLRQAVQRYPDDPDFWYLLGETYYHPPNRLVTEDEAKRVFSRALALDPHFAHYYLHPIEIAFHQADSANAANLIQTYGRIAPEDEEESWQQRLAFSLAFGDLADRSRALGALDTLPITAVSVVSTYLSHPRFGRIQELSLHRILARPDEPPRWLPWQLFQNLLNRGRFRAALEYVDDDELSSIFFQPFIAYVLVESGMALPPERIDRDLSGTGDPQRRNAFWAGAYAADHGRWAAHDAAVRLLRAAAYRFKASGDSLDADFHETAANALEAYGQWKRGHGAEALPILEAIFHGPADPTGGMLKWWLGELSLELGKRREAALYFGSIWGGENALLRTRAEFYLGEIYTDLGEFEKARESYEYALLAWRDADPELRPRIQQARRALARLPKLLRRERP
ncbi:MAG TPA: adenylate/guanylate cyclase domain-containing protein [Longimicrobiaceae bacterium]|nr:adenylate/guanylate cyclase domain-containing protein [Longimicrobiaceae bacterium]